MHLKFNRLVVCTITKIKHFILSIVYLYFQELQRVSKSRKWRAEETIQLRGQTGMDESEGTLFKDKNFV